MSDTADFFRGRLDQMIDLRHPLVVLGARMPWQEIEASVDRTSVRPPSARGQARAGGGSVWSEHAAGWSRCIEGVVPEISFQPAAGRAAATPPP